MGHWCCVRGCTSNSNGRKMNHGVRFFSFPTWKRGYGQQMEDITKRRRTAWVAAVRRKDITFDNISSFVRVCSRHFHKGQPAYEMMEADPDWAPSLHLGHTEIKPTDAERSARRANRSQLKNVNTPQAAETETGDAGDQGKVEVKQEAEEYGPGQTVKVKQEAEEYVLGQTVKVKQEVEEYDLGQTVKVKQEAEEYSLGQTVKVKQEAEEYGLVQTIEVKQEPEKYGLIQIEVKQEAEECGLLQIDVKQEAEEYGLVQIEVKEEAAECGLLQTDGIRQEAAGSGLLQTDEEMQEAPAESCQPNSGNGTVQEPGQAECNMCVLRRAEVNRLLEENRGLRRELNKLRITDDFFGGDDEKVKYYTGLPNQATFMAIFTFLQPHMSVHKKILTPFQMLLLTFMRLRLDLPTEHLAHLFQVSPKTVYRTFTDMVSCLYTNLRHMIVWPDRETSQRMLGNVCQRYKILTGTTPINVMPPCEGEEVTASDKIVSVCCALTHHCPTVN